jgi:saccharopine dehydrogenase (NAD+, L-lysine-forming)
MDKVRIGVIKETKTPPDKRVPLTPAQCIEVEKHFPNVEVFVQPSDIRKYPDQAYLDAGVKMKDDLSDCDILMGVKEVKMDALIPGKTYLFFSHTFKLQPYNATLLRTILDKKIRLVDYEVLTDDNGFRLIGFGRYAGIVGCYNGFLAYGKKHGLYELKPANQCEDREEMEGELAKVNLPANTRIVMTGHGRVGRGAKEIISQLDITEVSPEDFLSNEYDHPVYTHIDSAHHNERISDGGFDKAEFYADASGYKSNFPRYASKADLYIACHYWADDAPFIFTRDDMKDPNWRVSVVADISCDIDGPVACTLRPSTVADPLYGYDPATEKEADFMAKGAIGVMAVDNLPCELPKDASADFGNEMIDKILPHLINDPQGSVIHRAAETTLDGELNEPFRYLEDYVKNA